MTLLILRTSPKYLKQFLKFQSLENWDRRTWIGMEGRNRRLVGP